MLKPARCSPGAGRLQRMTEPNLTRVQPYRQNAAPRLRQPRRASERVIDRAAPRVELCVEDAEPVVGDEVAHRKGEGARRVQVVPVSQVQLNDDLVNLK